MWHHTQFVQGREISTGLSSHFTHVLPAQLHGHVWIDILMRYQHFHFYVLIILTNYKYSVNRFLTLFHVFWFLNICLHQNLISDSNTNRAYFLPVSHHLKCAFCVSIPFKTPAAELPWTDFLSPSSYHPSYLICTCILQFNVIWIY